MLSCPIGGMGFSSSSIKMTLKEIQEVIGQGEGLRLEFKSSFNDEVIETVVAFSNTVGGIVIIGIDNKKKLIGVHVGEETIQKIVNEIKNKTNPSVFVDIESLNVDAKHILIIRVQEYPIKPISFKGRYYKRVKNSNHLLTVGEVVQLHQITFNTSWDYAIDYNHSLDDISMEKVARFISLANKNRLIPIDDTPLDVLKKFELIREGRITIACYLLFCKNDTLLSTVELGRFETETSISDGLTIRGDLLGQVDSILSFIGKHIKKAYIITGKAQREERYDYPQESLREIVLNMIVHRDYSHSSDSIIKIFDDKIEFFNPGGLLPPLTVDKLKSGNYSSITRNKQIATLFKEVGLIEKYGSGVRRITHNFLVNSLPEPKFENFQHGFRVTVYSKFHEINEKVVEKVVENLTEHQKKIVESITENPKISALEISKTIGLSHRKTQENFKKLKDKGVLKRIGPAKGGHWEIVKK